MNWGCILVNVLDDGSGRLFSSVLVGLGLYSSVLDDRVWWVVMSGFCQSQVHIAAAAPVTLLLSQDGSREDETDADDKTYGDADCCWC